MRLVVFGATGHTGKLLRPRLVERGASVLACGRDADALAALAKEGYDTRQVDVMNAGDVRGALVGADGVANLAGPFLATGPIPIEAALRRGIPYVDTTGEQAFMRMARRRYHERAIDSNAPVVNALAYEYALADLAVRAHLPEGGDALHILYRPRGAGASLGTKKTIARVMSAPSASYEHGRLVKARPARYRRTFQTAQGPRDAVSFPGGEPLTVPRHTRFDTVRTYVPSKRPLVAQATAPLARALVRGPILRLVERGIERRHREPRNERAGAEIHLVAEGPGRRIVLTMGDPYVITAEVCAEGLVRLVKGSAIGVLAPAEALDATEVLAALHRRLPDFTVTVDESHK